MSAQKIAAFMGCVLLLGTTAIADETSVQAGQWQCGTPKNSKSGYQCDALLATDAIPGDTDAGSRLSHRNSPQSAGPSTRAAVAAPNSAESSEFVDPFIFP